mmetsp:Transcript_116433/g.183175  ORF Transcript_116433/g.183175 Transcript_116433/m.183175 type:complete len:287 (+) Transcript_116433:71-931(+)
MSCDSLGHGGKKNKRRSCRLSKVQAVNRFPPISTNTETWWTDAYSEECYGVTSKVVPPSSGKELRGCKTLCAQAAQYVQELKKPVDSCADGTRVADLCTGIKAAEAESVMPVSQPSNKPPKVRRPLTHLKRAASADKPDDAIRRDEVLPPTNDPKCKRSPFGFLKDAMCRRNKPYSDCSKDALSHRSSSTPSGKARKMLSLEQMADALDRAILQGVGSGCDSCTIMAWRSSQASSRQSPKSLASPRSHRTQDSIDSAILQSIDTCISSTSGTPRSCRPRPRHLDIC